MVVYDEIEIEDLEFDMNNQTFWYDCPCGDKFRITLEELRQGQNIAECPSCTLQIRIIFSKEDLEGFKGLMPKVGISI